ncbi:MAG: flavodoxin family protein [Bacillota bacterium]
MNLSIVYHSESGNTKKVAEIIKTGVENVEGFNVKTMHIDETDVEYINSSKAVIFGTPTYTGDLSHQMKNWFGNYPSEIDFSGKLGAVFATQKYVGGGADVALKTMIGHLLVKGMVVYSAGAGEGKPFTHFGAVCIQSGNEEQKERAEIFGKRIAKKTLELFL